MRRALLTVLILAGCVPGERDSGCHEDQIGLVWTNERLMRSYDHRRDQIDGEHLCYPNTGLTSRQLERGKPCPHPNQRVTREDGILVCRCGPRPDVLFTDEEIARWCPSGVRKRKR